MTDDGKTYSGSCATCQHSSYRDKVTVFCKLAANRSEKMPVTARTDTCNDYSGDPGVKVKA